VTNRTVALVAAAILSVVAPGTLSAGEYYVSPTGTGAWSECTTATRPCSATTAMANAQAGDTVFFRGGQYEVGQSTATWPPTFAWNPAHSGTAERPIVFRAYPGERPVVNGTVSGTNAGTWTGYNENTGVLGAIHRSHITWDGFTVQANNGAKMATVYIMGENGSADNCTIRNFIFNGGKQQTADGNNWEGLRVEGTSGLTVSNSRFFGYSHVAGNHNTSAYKGYGNRDGVLENLEISNSTVGIFLKGTHHGFVLRGNFIHDCARGIYVTPQTPRMLSDGGRVYNNVVVNTSYAAFESDSDNSALHGDDWEIYNNTFYNNGVYGIAVSGNTAGHGWKIYNNIVAHPGRLSLLGRIYTTLAEVDHNQWGAGGPQVTLRIYQANQKIYTSLSAWQASRELETEASPGVGDLASDPGFSNGSGTLSQKSDFVLSSTSKCRGAGRGGADLGALNIPSRVGLSGSVPESPTAPGRVTVKRP